MLDLLQYLAAGIGSAEIKSVQPKNKLICQINCFLSIGVVFYIHKKKIICQHWVWVKHMRKMVRGLTLLQLKQIASYIFSDKFNLKKLIYPSFFFH